MIDASALKEHYDQEGFVLIESLFGTSEIQKLQRGILLIDVIQHDPDRKQIRVGVGIKGPILMPINSSAAFCGLDVQFTVSKTDILTNQDSQDFQ